MKIKKFDEMNENYITSEYKYELDLSLVGDSDMEEVRYIIEDLESRLNVIVNKR